jgi:hypothetical protein
MLSPLTLADSMRFLADAGFPVTARGEGTYDIANTFEAASEEAVLEVHHRLHFWPKWPSPPLCGQRGQVPVASYFCGGSLPGSAGAGLLDPCIQGATPSR